MLKSIFILTTILAVASTLTIHEQYQSIHLVGRLINQDTEPRLLGMIFNKLRPDSRQ